MWAVSDKKIFDKYSYNEAYGISAAMEKSSWFPKDGKSLDGYYGSHNNSDRLHFDAEQVEVDMLLDVDKGELNFCVVGQLEKGEAKMFGLPIGGEDGNGWVPHMNTTTETTSLKIAKIAVEFYGQSMDEIFSSA